MTALRVTVLGCGGSAGVPQLGGEGERGAWGRCDPQEPRNRRTRSSIIIEGAGGGRLLVDAGPDLRQQLLSAGMARLNAVLFTHSHADHILGVDDLRGVNRVINGPLPVFGSARTMRELDERFDYAFRGWDPPFFFRPVLEPSRVEAGESFVAAGLEVRLFRQDHGVMETLGLRIGGFAYSTDVVRLPETSLAALEGLDTWMVGCFQRAPHQVHAGIAQVSEWVKRLRPRRTVLTHMGNDLDFAELARELPPGIEPAFDGMVLEVAAG